MLAADYLTASGEHRDVLNAYRMFAYDKGWVRRMEASIDLGLAAEVAVEKEQSATRARMSPRRRPLPSRTAARPRRSRRTGCCGCSPATSGNGARAARRRDPRRPQHRAGRAPRLWPQASRRRARGGLGRQPRGDRRARAGDPAGDPGHAHHPRGHATATRSWSTATRASSTCAPRTPSPRRSARRSTCCTRRRRPMPRCATSLRPPATG